MKKLILLALLVLALAAPCSAADVSGREAEILNTDSLYGGLSQSARESLGEVTPTSSAGFGEQLWKLVSDVLSGSSDAIRTAVKSACMYECLYVEDVPVGAAINEAVELTRKYEDEDVVSFVNGILGTFAREAAAK